jgi:hypothetical protein
MRRLCSRAVLFNSRLTIGRIGYLQNQKLGDLSWWNPSSLETIENRLRYFGRDN